MFILTVEGKEKEGAYAVEDDVGAQILYLFEEEDDALRYAMMLEDVGFPTMNIIEVEEDLMIKSCTLNGYEYAVITKNDIIVPPQKHDYV